MTREEAIKFFEKMLARNDKKARSYEPDFRQERMEEAHDAAMVALSALQPWVKTADKPPTKRDGIEVIRNNRSRFVLCMNVNCERMGLYSCQSVANCPEVFSQWMTIPTPLEEEE